MTESGCQLPEKSSQVPNGDAPIRAALENIREAARQLEHAKTDGRVSYDEYTRRAHYLTFAEDYIQAALSGYVG